VSILSIRILLISEYDRACAVCLLTKTAVVSEISKAFIHLLSTLQHDNKCFDKESCNVRKSQISLFCRQQLHVWRNCCIRTKQSNCFANWSCSAPVVEEHCRNYHNECRILIIRLLRHMQPFTSCFILILNVDRTTFKNRAAWRFS